jgi:hypothetical protein
MAKADIDKSKQELIEELKELRGRLAGRDRSDQLKARSRRVPLEAEIELIADFDLLQATGINISETGIAFESAQPLFFEMRFKHQGRLHHQRARLVWMKSGEQGQSRLGLEFCRLPQRPEI